jgi:hypothetical protein
MSLDQSDAPEPELQDGAYLSGVLQIQCLQCLHPYDYEFCNDDHTTIPEADSSCPHCGALIPVAVLVGVQAGQLDLLEAELLALWALRSEPKRQQEYLRELMRLYAPEALTPTLVGPDGQE